MRYIQVYALFLMLAFCTSCGGQNKPGFPIEKDNFHTNYEYTDAAGNSLIIQNSFPRGDTYTDPDGREYTRAVFWTRIINETDNALEMTINFSGDSYELPGSVGSSVSRYFKIILPSDTMARNKEHLYNYGLTDLDSFLVNNINKPSSLKRTINPKGSSGIYVVRLLLKPRSDRPGVKDDGNGTTRAGFSLKGQDLFYALNGKEIHCGRINLKNLTLQE